ncbi:MAG: CHASE2 domain-containing protein [Elusimicrobia bacterium]|nr:CHASE2 domain-containing protein [Elusimicrobiota bacterium]
MKSKSLWVEALIGLALTLFVLFGYVAPGSIAGSLTEALELKSYDKRSALRDSIDAGGADIALIAIDDESLARLGRWPWPRARLAQMIDHLVTAKARVIGLSILLSESEQNQGLAEIQALQARYDELIKSKKLIDKGSNFSLEFSSSAVRLNSDEKLRASIAAARNVVLPMYFSGGGPVGAKPEPLPPALSSGTLSVKLASAEEAGLGAVPELEGAKPIIPITSFVEGAKGVGYDNLYQDFDGVVRAVYPTVKYDGKFLPSFPLELVARYLGFEHSDVKVRPGKMIEFGNTKVPLDENNKMLVTFTYNGGGSTGFRSYSFFDVLNGKVSMDVFKDKIVLLGATAAGVATLYVTPVSRSLPGMEVEANVIENILSHKFLVRPEWAFNAELGATVFIGLFIMFLLPRMRAFSGAAISLLFVVALYGAGTYLFVKGQWLKVTYPAFLLGVGYVVIQTKRFIFTERGKELVEASAIETNKMLGLSFQGQGMLDLSFDKFRLCPIDDQLKDLLYNLALDFERKRQYNKAVAVYEHIATKDPKYKDIQDKIKVLKQASEGAVFGGIGGGHKEGTVLMSGGASKPTLGRYEIEKELGRGAMGIVYLGKDPKINRKVAIKTMMMEEGTDAAAVKETKERFFREAESAGTLNHPNIIRIFDAGEEHDVCYIAMELLDGHDFTKYTAKEALLPLDKLVEYFAQVAEALDYAHAQGIVHRDIKPANIMHLKDGTVRVADFGIARITASSKTATGTVMGTPSYMSPEQVAGKKVDGRSDLFSLGVALYEMSVGEKPFKGGEGIGTLLFQIANDPEPEPTQVNANVPPGLSQVIHKALKKNPDERYQRGSQMAADLRTCLSGAKPAEAAAPAPAAASVPASTTMPVPTAELPAAVAVAAASAMTPEELAASIIAPPSDGTTPVPVQPVEKTVTQIQLPAVDVQPAPQAAPAPAPASADSTIRLTTPKEPA